GTVTRGMTVFIANSADVSFTDCTAALFDVTNSSVSLVGCTVPVYDWQGAVVVQHSGDVVISGGNYIGTVPFSFPVPEPAIFVESGTMTITGGAVIRCSCDGPPYLHAYAPGPAIDSTGGAIRLDPSVQLVTHGFVPQIQGPVQIIAGVVPDL